MTNQRKRTRLLRVHLPIAADARTDDRHPGRLLAGLASIVRLGGHPVAYPAG